MSGGRFSQRRGRGEVPPEIPSMPDVDVSELRNAVRRPSTGYVFVCEDGSRLHILDTRRRLTGGDLLFLKLSAHGMVTLESLWASRLKDLRPISVTRGMKSSILDIAKPGSLLIPGEHASLDSTSLASACTVLQPLPNGELLCLTPRSAGMAVLEPLSGDDLWRYAPSRVVTGQGALYLDGRVPSLAPGARLHHTSGLREVVMITTQRTDELSPMSIEVITISRSSRGHVEVNTRYAADYLEALGWHLDTTPGSGVTKDSVRALQPANLDSRERSRIHAEQPLRRFLGARDKLVVTDPVALALDLLCHPEGLPGPFSRVELDRLFRALETTTRPSLQWMLYDAIDSLLREHNERIVPACDRAEIVEEYHRRLLESYEPNPHREQMKILLQNSAGRRYRRPISI